jgi:hypothetical protein
MRWVLSIIIGLIVTAFAAGGEPIAGIALATFIGIIWGVFASVKHRVQTEHHGTTTSAEVAGVGYVVAPGPRTPPVPTVALGAGDIEAQLTTLKTWFDRQLITQTDYDAQKADILARWTASSPPKRRLATQAEYDAPKADILARWPASSPSEQRPARPSVSGTHFCPACGRESHDGVCERCTTARTD